MSSPECEIYILVEIRTIGGCKLSETRGYLDVAISNVCSQQINIFAIGYCHQNNNKCYNITWEVKQQYQRLLPI